MRHVLSVIFFTYIFHCLGANTSVPTVHYLAGKPHVMGSPLKAVNFGDRKSWTMKLLCAHDKELIAAYPNRTETSYFASIMPVDLSAYWNQFGFHIRLPFTFMSHWYRYSSNTFFHHKTNFTISRFDLNDPSLRIDYLIHEDNGNALLAFADLIIPTGGKSQLPIEPEMGRVGTLSLGGGIYGKLRLLEHGRHTLQVDGFITSYVDAEGDANLLAIRRARAKTIDPSSAGHSSFFILPSEDVTIFNMEASERVTADMMGRLSYSYRDFFIELNGLLNIAEKRTFTTWGSKWSSWSADTIDVAKSDRYMINGQYVDPSNFVDKHTLKMPTTFLLKLGCSIGVSGDFLHKRSKREHTEHVSFGMFFTPVHLNRSSEWGASFNFGIKF